MMKPKILNQSRRIALASVILGIAWSCQKDVNHEPVPENKSPAVLKRSEMIKLGQRLENPHSLNNMRKAYENLLSSGSGRITDEIILEATDLYVRFLPESFTELEFLLDDTTLIFFDHPLDYEFEEYGGYYHDPDIPDTLPTWQYVVVPVGYEFPKVHFEIIDSAFVPNNYEHNSESGRITIDEEFLDQLEEESFILTGNWERSANAKNCPDFRPSGYIRVNSRAIEGVDVVATNFLDNKSDFTNASGYYYIDHKFRRSVKMHVKWQRYQFHVKDKWLNEAQYIDKEECGNWSVNFADQSEQAFHAHIFRAAYHYYYKSIQSLRRPPQNGVFKERMQMRAYYENNDEVDGRHREERRILGNWIKIYNPFRTEDRIYATTIHELAHASHWNLQRGSSLDDTNSKVKESWATGVQWVLTRMTYSNYLGRLRSTDDYTLVVADMIDGSATLQTRTNRGYIDSDGSDNVSGYTVKELEDALVGKRTWNSWRDNIKNKFENGTEDNLNGLFAAYE